MRINLFDDRSSASLRPLTFTRPVADLRVGILTIAGKWEKYSSSPVGFITAGYLQAKYPALERADIYINGAVCPDSLLFQKICGLKNAEVLIGNSKTIAFKAMPGQVVDPEDLKGFKPVQYQSAFTYIQFPEDIFRLNDAQLRADFSLLTSGRKSAKISETNIILGNQFFAEEGAVAECSTFNTRTGPIYLGKDAQVWEGSHIRGSFALCENSQVKMGSKIYGQTTIGPFSRVGGEINNAVIWGYSSKGHEGYLGNAVLGQWCNIGADSNNSNLKNTYGDVKLWDYAADTFRNTGLQFCGLIMADHAKCGINTMFNTGTVAGVSANVFGSGYPRNFIPDFAWGGAHGFDTYNLEKMLETTEKVFQRRNMELTTIEKDILAAVFEQTRIYRHF